MQAVMVKRASTGDQVEFPTKKDALAHLRALYANVKGAQVKDVDWVLANMQRLAKQQRTALKPHLERKAEAIPQRSRRAGSSPGKSGGGWTPAWSHRPTLRSMRRRCCASWEK